MSIRRWGWRLGLLLCLGLLLFAGLLARRARAVEVRSGDVVVIERGEVIDDDLLISANKVVVEGTVNGDLWVAARDVQVEGPVNGSVFLAGGLLRVNGTVDGSAYVAGSTAIIGPRADVSRNLYFAGFGLRLTPGSIVQQDVLATGNQALVRGRVGRNLSFGGAGLEIAGTVGNNVEAAVAQPGQPQMRAPFASAEAGSVASGILVTEDARIGGKLTYSSPVQQAARIRSQPAGGVTFRQTEDAEVAAAPAAGVRWVLTWIRLFLTLLALGALALFGFGAPVQVLAQRALTVPLLSVGWGILIILAGLTAALVAGLLILLVTGVLSVLTLGGLAATVFLGAGTGWAFGLSIFMLAVIFGSRIVVSYLVGWLVLARLAGQREPAPIYVLLVGVAIYSLAESIPFLGGLAAAIAVVLGFGAIYLVGIESQTVPAV